MLKNMRIFGKKL